MKKVSEVFKSIRFAKLDPKHDKGPKMSTDDEEHYTVGEKEFDQQVKHIKKRAMQENVTRRGFLKGLAAGGAAAAAGKAHAIAGAFPSPSTRAKWAKDAEISNAAEAKRQAEIKRKEDADRLERNTKEVEKEQRKNHHSLATEQAICQQCQNDPCICDDSHGFVTETKRMSAAVKLQRAFEREQSKSEASRGRMATAKEQDDALERTKKLLSKPETMAVLKRLKNEGYNGYHNNRTGFAKREREDDEYHNGPDPVKHTFTHTVSKEGGEKHQRTVTTGLTTRPKHEFEKVARQHLEKQGYTIHEEIEIQEGRMADKAAGDLDFNPEIKNDKPPFDGPYKKKSSATPGKHGSGYSTARHLARQAMNKVAKTKLKEDSELSRKAQIVKGAAKKTNKSEDKFEPNPVLSKHSGTSDK